MEKTYDFVIKPLKKWPAGNHVSIFIFENWDSHNQNSQLKKFEKICRQLLSTMNVDVLNSSLIPVIFNIASHDNQRLVK